NRCGAGRRQERIAQEAQRVLERQRPAVDEARRRKPGTTRIGRERRAATTNARRPARAAAGVPGRADAAISRWRGLRHDRQTARPDQRLTARAAESRNEIAAGKIA